MTKPLVVFTGAALATLAALLGVTADKWKAQPVSATGSQISSGSADAAPSPPATVEAEKQDAGAVGKTGTNAVSPSELAAVSPEAPALVEPAPPSGDPNLMADDSKPSFDTIRVEPDGAAVIAGRGLPDSEVAILFNDQPIGSAKADATGAWVLVPTEPLPVGDHQVTLRMEQPNAPPVFSEQSVALKVPERGTDQAMVVLSEENQPSKVLQQPKTAVVDEPDDKPVMSEPVATPQAATEPAATQPAATEPPAAPAEESQIAVATPDAGTAADATAAPDAPATEEPESSPPQALAKLPLNLGTVDYNDRGDIIFSGTANGGATVRLYVDNNHVGDATAETGGQWQFAGRENIRPGTHSLRVDKLNVDGSVAERVELPFVRAEPEAVAALIEQAPAPASAEPAAAAISGTQPAAGAPAAVDEAAAAGVAQEPAAATASEQAGEVAAASTAGEVAVTDEPPSGAPAAEEVVAAAAAEGTSDQGAVAAAEPPASTAPAAAPEAPEVAATGELPAVASAAAEEAASAAPAQDQDAATNVAPVESGTAEPPAAAPAAEEIASAAPAQDTAADAPTEMPAAAPAAEDTATDVASAEPAAEPPAAAPAAEEVASAAPTKDTAAEVTLVEPGAAEPPAAAPAAEEIAAADPAQDSSAGGAAQAPATPSASPATESDATSGANGETLSAPAPTDQLALEAGSGASPELAPAAGTGETTAAEAVAAQEAGQPRNGRIVIQPGNNLWRISRVIYGQGVQYTIIYQANKEQIRNPDLIYPGQIFATPGVVAPEMIDPKRKEPLPGVAGATTSG